MLKYSTFSVRSLNIYLARKVLIVLLISGTLITSIAVSGQTFATTIGKPDIGIDDGLTTKGEGTEDEETDEGDNETASARQTGGLGEFCLEGTGGTTGQPCIPCDPTQPTPGMGTNCPIISGGGEIMQKNVTKSKNVEKGVLQGDLLTGLRNETGTTTEPKIVQYAQKLKELQAIKDPSELIIVKLQDLENGGKLPAQTTEKFKSALKGDPSSLKALCDIVSTSKSGFVKSADCDSLPTEPTNGTNVYDLGLGILLGIVGAILYDVLKNDIDSFPTDCVLATGSNVVGNPGGVPACFD